MYYTRYSTYRFICSAKDNSLADGNLEIGEKEEDWEINSERGNANGIDADVLSVYADWIWQVVDCGWKIFQ